MSRTKNRRKDTLGHRPQPSDDLTSEEYAAEFKRMVVELDGHTTRAHRRVWWFARDSGMSVEQFTKANWWVEAGFNNRVLELFWMLCQNDDPAHQSHDGFLDACRNGELTRYRNVGEETIKQALTVLGYHRRRTRCKLCGAYNSPELHGYKGGKKVDLYKVAKQPKEPK